MIATTCFRRALPFLSVLLLAAPAHAQWPHLPGTYSLISGSPGSQENPDIVSDGNEGAYIAWSDFRSGTSQAYIQHVDMYGRALWAADGIRVSNLETYGTAVRLASDGAGGVVVAWFSDVRPRAQRFNAAGTALWAAGGVALQTGSSGFNPRITADGAGNFVIVWQDSRNGFLDIYGQKISSAGALLWADLNGTAVCSAPGHQFMHGVIADGLGGSVVGWVDNASGHDEFFAQRLNANGVTQWAPNGVSMITVVGGARTPGGMVSDGAGGAIFVWDDTRNDVCDVFAQRISGAGNPLWGGNGTIVRSAVNAQIYSKVLSDGVGGAIVTWADFAAGISVDISAQRLNASGALQWAPSGVALCTAPNGRYLPGITTDGQGGAVVAWRDYRNSPAGDIYARRVNGSGVPQWTANGVQLGLSDGSFTAPVIAPSSRGAIVAWHTDRGNGGNDLLAQRVDGYGNLGAPEPRIASVRDVPNDQGGKVKLSWDASYLDNEAPNSVTNYMIFRSAPPGSAPASAKPLGALKAARAAPGSLWSTQVGTATYYWELLTYQSAFHYLQGYSYLAPTTGDSLPGSNPRTAFMVVAQDYNNFTYLSGPDSGYSADNVAPAAPAPFTAMLVISHTHLEWDPNSEADIAGYRLYRGTSSGFVPSPANLIASLSEPGYVDPGNAIRYYKVSAVDTHGNEGPYSTVLPTGTLDAPSGTVTSELALRAPGPNPATQRTMIHWALPADGAVSLQVFDAAGRRARTLERGVSAAGEHTTPFDLTDDAGRQLGAGLYFIRLEFAGRRIERKLVVTL